MNGAWASKLMSAAARRRKAEEFQDLTYGDASANPPLAGEIDAGHHNNTGQRRGTRSTLTRPPPPFYPLRSLTTPNVILPVANYGDLVRIDLH